MGARGGNTLETVGNAKGNTYPLGSLGLQVGVYFKGDSVHEVVIDDRDVEDVVRIVLQLIMLLSADAGRIVQSDQITVFIGVDAVILNIPEELCQCINVLGRPGEPLDVAEKRVLGLKKLAEGEVMVSASIV